MCKYPHIGAVHTAMYPLSTFPMHAGIGRFPYRFRITMASATASTPVLFSLRRRTDKLLANPLVESPGVDALPLNDDHCERHRSDQSDTDRRTVHPPK